MLSDNMAWSINMGWNRKKLATGILALSGILLVGMVSYSYLFRSEEAKVENETPQEQAPEAELVAASGIVLMCQAGRPEWQEVKTGARLEEGSLIRTDSSGSARIRFDDGTTVFVQENTVFTVQSADDSAMEISPPPQMDLLMDETEKAETGSSAALLSDAKAGELRPFIELQRIIPFGRSLELIGNVEAGSRLFVNGESVEVGGDGSYKHFTNPFPAYARKVDLAMKVTNLAGQTRTLRTTYDFSSHGEDD
jgi:hypothetical protein